MSAWKRLRALVLRDRLDRDLDDEIHSHIGLATEHHLRRGDPPAAARHQALLRLGAIETTKNAHRDSRGFAWLEGLFYDLRHALRGLARDRGFTLTSTMMLA